MTSSIWQTLSAILDKQDKNAAYPVHVMIFLRRKIIRFICYQFPFLFLNRYKKSLNHDLPDLRICRISVMGVKWVYPVNP
ncbi:hypothetical protein THIOM_004118 [Candidatus Thiomargarita nelsonii]|uniref:Uncharacterized protein n=1 Tax=Candidatus Thiomargarita nelsonii TaxID=1003181 RepID=A0A176RWP4_9GAMM|nr:hypothetical protein THIOM_004118 [Candidatus Thiomargarita nelsonii]